MTATTAFPKTLPPITALALRKTMLVVDPQRKVSRLLDELVSEEGWNLQHAADNEAALALIRDNAYDLVLTGQKTSGAQDLKLLKAMRLIRPHVRMIILTDQATPGDVISSLRENVFSYFRTPFSRDYFVQMVRLAMIQEDWDDGIEVIAATRNWIRLLARCTKETACRLGSFLRQSNLPDAEKADLVAATHEILTNAMEHGAKFDPNKYVELAYLRTQRAVTCRVKDPGEGFALEELRHAAINNPPGDLFSHIPVREKLGMREGGFGILIAKKLVDEVIYGEHGNDVLLIKYLDSAEPAVSPMIEPADA